MALATPRRRERPEAVTSGCGLQACHDRAAGTALNGRPPVQREPCVDLPNDTTIPPSTSGRRRSRVALILTLATAVALALLAAVTLLAMSLHFEAQDRESLHQQMEKVRAVLARVDNAEALATLAPQLELVLGGQAHLAVRVQGAHGQPLFEQSTPAQWPRDLLARASPSDLAPLVTWRAGPSTWRGMARILRMPLDGAAPLTVAAALDVQDHESFLASFRIALIGYVTFAVLAFALLARWATRDTL